MIAAGRLKALMITRTNRLPLLPTVPSAVEVGLLDNVLYGWGGLCVPAGTPVAVIKVLNEQALAAVLAQPLRAELEKVGYEVGENTSSSSPSSSVVRFNISEISQDSEAFR